MRIRFLLIGLILTNVTDCQDYKVYNNLTTIANKLNVAQRYQEANMLYSSVFKQFETQYKSIDLFYWALALTHCGEQKKAFQILLLSSEKSNDSYNIFYFTKEQKEFSYLSDKELEKIKVSQRKVDEKGLNHSLVKQINYIDSIDAYWQNFYLDSIMTIGENDPKRSKQAELFEDHMKLNSAVFSDLIIENGYPNYLETNYSVSHLLYHLSSSDWVRVEEVLINGLNKGYLRPFDFAYAYLRTHNEDRYDALEFIEIEMRSEPYEKLILKEMGDRGLGI